VKKTIGAILGCLVMIVATRAGLAEPGYLGIGTAPLEPALAGHLELDEGVGLTVVHVDDEGPTVEALKVNDVLRSLEGQILVNHEQLVTLVQQVYQAGSEVELTFYRRGKEKTAKVTLGELPAELANHPRHPQLRLGPPPQHGQPPQYHQFQWPQQNWHGPKGQGQPWQHHWKSFPDDLDGLQGHIQEWVKEMQERHGKSGRGWADEDEDDEDDDVDEDDDEDVDEDDDEDVQVRTFSSSQVKSKIVTSDGDMTMTLETDGESRHLKAERDGKILFDGDINTKAERKHIPDDIRDKLEEMESGVQIKIQTSGPDGGKAKGRAKKRIQLRRSDEVSI
jgi:hypothetical protein